MNKEPTTHWSWDPENGANPLADRTRCARAYGHLKKSPITSEVTCMRCLYLRVWDRWKEYRDAMEELELEQVLRDVSA